MSKVRATVLLIPISLILQRPWAEAQTIATSFDELGQIVDLGDTLSVTDASGRDVTGRLERLTTSTLTLTVDEQSTSFDATMVNTIRERHFDSLRNGAFWGLAVGAASGLLAEAVVGSNEGAGIVAYPMFFAPVGGVIGVVADLVQRGQRTIYARRHNRISISPVFGKRERGVRLSLRF